MAWPHSGTRWSRFIFIRAAERVHTWSVVSISSHAAKRTSPERAAVSTKNSNANLSAGFSRDARTVATAAATSRCGSAPHVLDDVALRAEHRPDPVGRVVAAQVHRNGPLQHGVETLPDGPWR